MSVLLRPMIRALGLTIVGATAAVAQGAQKACEVNEGRPTQVGRATLNVQVASSAQDPAAAGRQLTSAVKALTENPERIDNQAGRNLVLGKALVLWTMQPNVELVTKRGPLGYTTNPEGMIDLAAAIDTAFKMVEAAHPECIAETSRWRGQKAWVALVNKAIERLNAEDADSAELVARQAIALNPYGPYGYVVLANVMQKRNKSTEAFELYRKSIEMASRDTTFDDIRRQSLVYLGNLAADSAEMAANATARKPYIETAQGAFSQLIADKGAEEFKENARAGLCRVAIVAGDTGSLRTTYKDQLSSPAGHEYSVLMNAGVCMARAEMIPEATALFSAAYEKNQYHRDALSNLSIMLLRNDRHEESLPLAARLVSVEPNNPENIQLLVLSYAGIAKRSRDARMAGSKAGPATKTGTKTKAATATKAAGPRLSAAAQDSLFKIEKAYTDSAVALNEKKDKLAFRVALSDFSTSDEKATVAGTVHNQGTSEKSVTIKVEFLDRTGKVVTTKEATVNNIAAGGSGRFNVSATPGKEIAAFRYAPLQ
jgi:tetratricopeptide (TPR) repeat protein